MQSAHVRKPPIGALQLKVTLRHTGPPIWRRILVRDNLTFWDLHVAIQNAMGWSHRHLHQFVMQAAAGGESQRIGIPDEESYAPIRAGWQVAVLPTLNRSRPGFSYVYDFGDWWDHEVTFEEALDLDDGPYPRCVDGGRHCPPEDCGGPPGYAELLVVLADPTDPRHAELAEWVGEPYDPAAFETREVVFDDPDEVLAETLETGE